MDASHDLSLRALRFLTAALQALDDSDAPADIGAHVEHAISRLSETFGSVDQTLPQVGHTVDQWQIDQN